MLLLLVSILPWQTSDAARREIASSVLARGVYQTVLPAEPVPRAEGTPGDRPALPRSESTDPDRETMVGGGLSLLARLVLWGLLAMVLAIAATLLIHRPRSEPAMPAPSEPARPRSAPLPPLPQRAERARELADEGRFDEAVHVLLLAALTKLSPRAPWTAREILGRCQAEDLGSSLSLMIDVSERSRFGGRPAASSDFERSWQAYRDFESILVQDHA